MKPDIKKMSLREKIAQTLLVRQSDLLMRADKDYMERRAPEEAAEIMKECQFGGLWMHGSIDVNAIKGSLNKSFSFTTQSYNEWAKDVLAAAKYPVICAGDAVGQWAFKDLSKIALGLTLGAANSDELSYQMGYRVGLEHSMAGCNWIWSPMVDLVSPYASGIVRPFAGDTDLLIRCAKEYDRGMQDAGVAACAKHFPGADPSEMRDSHVVTTSISGTVEEWEKNQGRVFKELIDAGVYTIMTGAVSFPAADTPTEDGNYLPAALSKNITTGLLKEKLGFKGVVISDDVTMGGYTSVYGHNDLYVELLKAGNDVLLGVGIDAVDIVLKGVMDGRLSEERIDDACRRVLELKEKLGLFDENREVIELNVQEETKKTAELLQKVADKGITLERDIRGLIPVSKEKIKKVTIVMYSHFPIADILQTMKTEFEQRGAEVLLRDKLESFTDAEKTAQESDLIVYAGYIGFHRPKGAPSFYDDVFWSLRYAFTQGKEKSIGVSLGYPFILNDFMDDALAFANLYVPCDETQKAFVAALYGEKKFEGIAPLDMTRSYAWKK